MVTKNIDWEDFNKNPQKYNYAADAANRHMRRHSDAYKEYGIFVECIFI